MFKKIKSLIKRVISTLNVKVFLRITRVRHLFPLYQFFSKLKKDDYVLVKKDLNFPRVKIGSDFDIYTKNIEQLTIFINSYYKMRKNYHLTHNKLEDGHEHIDIFYRNRFKYKLDIYDNNLNSLIHNKTFIEDVMNTSSITQFRYFFKFEVNLPCDEMDLIIRIFEFYSHPHKIHHELIINSASESTLNNAKKKIQNYSSIKLDEFLASLK